MTFASASCWTRASCCSRHRTNAGIDDIAIYRKMFVFERPGDRVMVLMTSGNLA